MLKLASPDTVMAVPATLRDRLRLNGSGERSERPAMARAAFYLFAVGGLLALVSLTLPTEQPRNEAALAATALTALAFSFLPLVAFDRLPVWAFELLCAGGTLLASTALYVGGADAYEFFYFWVALYAAYFFGHSG